MRGPSHPERDQDADLMRETLRDLRLRAPRGVDGQDVEAQRRRLSATSSTCLPTPPPVALQTSTM